MRYIIIILLAAVLFTGCSRQQSPMHLPTVFIGLKDKKESCHRVASLDVTELMFDIILF